MKLDFVAQPRRAADIILFNNLVSSFSNAQFRIMTGRRRCTEMVRIWSLSGCSIVSFAGIFHFHTLVKIVGGKFEYDYRLLMTDVYDVVRCSTMLIIISLRRLITDHVS